MPLASPSTGIVARNVVINFDFEGFSRNASAPVGYEYLKATRRIKYTAQITMQIGYDFPFVCSEEFLDKMKSAAQNCSSFLGELKTCGVIAEYLMDFVLDLYPKTPRVVVIIKDGCSGEIAEYISSEEDQKAAYLSSIRNWNRTIGAHILIQKANEIKSRI